MRPFFLAALALFALFSLTACGADTARLAPDEAVRRVEAGTAVLVDVREPDEWAATGIVVGAEPLALSDLRGERREWKPFLERNRGREIILYCRSGNRSGQAASLLAGEGFRVANAGGLRDWVAAGRPVQALQPKKVP